LTGNGATHRNAGVTPTADDALGTAEPDEAEVLVPASPEEAAAAFGDGTDAVVLGGGTILMPDITYGRVKPRRVVLLARAGLDYVTDDGTTLTIGAATPLAKLEGTPEPLATAARYVGDPEIRAQATIGGNLCAGPGREYSRGDLQAALIALDAYVRSAGPGGERTEPVDKFLAAGHGSRLVIEIEIEARDRHGASAALTRPHVHSFTPLAVCATCSAAGGDLRVGAVGAGPHAVRLRSVEAGGLDGDPGVALGDVELADDALASAWYRGKMLPVLVGRVLRQLKESL
jgi:CO/xanthine dehydrogenase FAD-binding subunit